MLATEFYTKFQSVGESVLAALGFAHHRNGWFYHHDRFHLAVIPCAGKWERAFRVKRVVLAFAHSDVGTVDGVKPKRFDSDLLHYPLHIAPSLLAGFVKSGFDMKVWHYAFMADPANWKWCADSIFYGGYETPILADRKASTKKHTDHWQWVLGKSGVEYISDAEASKRIKKMFEEVKENYLTWANWCTHARVVSLLKNYGSGPNFWFEERLLKNYSKRERNDL